MKQTLIILLSITMFGSLFGKEKLTPLDTAYKNAIADQSKADDFYNLFLRSNIYIPTYDIPEKEASRRAGEDDTFNPVIIENGGRKTLILFDTFERLQGYATREIGYIAMPGHTLFEIMPDGIYWVLNHTTEYFKEFSPEEISYLKKRIKENAPQEKEVKEGTELLIGSPAQNTKKLESALLPILERNEEILSARIGQVYIIAEGEVPHLCLVITTKGINVTIKEAMTKDLVFATKGNLGTSEYIDIFIDESGQISETVISDVKPFYDKH